MGKIISLLLVLCISLCGCQILQENNYINLDRWYPETQLLAKYHEWSDIDYPIFKSANVAKGWLWFDDYSVIEIGNGQRIVTVKDYWYIDNGTWKKCDGEFVFKTNEYFIPVPIRKVEFEVLGQTCK